MNNEPVAWMLVTGHGTKIVEKKPYCQIDYWKPLYTHPAKTLTDEEILDALKDALSGWKYIRENHGDLYGVGWNRVQDKLEAILRKAQEK